MLTYINSTDPSCVRNDEQNLVYCNVLYNRFVLIQFNEEAKEKFLRIRVQKGIADPTPPSPTNHLAFRTYSTSLNAYLDNNRASLVDGTRMSDRLKSLVCELGSIILHCSDKGIKLDIDPELKNIYVAQDDYPLLKLVALPGNVEEHGPRIMVRAFKEMEVLIYGPDPADQSIPSTSKVPPKRRVNDFSELIDFCDRNVNSRRILRRFQSPLLWDKYRKYKMLSRLGDFVAAYPRNFRLYLGVNKRKLDNWRSVMTKHHQFGTIFFAPAKEIKRDKSLYSVAGREEANKAIEVDNLLILIRDTVMHFDTMCKGLNLANSYDLVEFYETAFPGIMRAIYETVEILLTDKVIKRKVFIGC